MLWVADTGSGMDAATRARIFEPFFTTKEVGKGTGLGLSTVYGIVKQSNGHIAVQSELNAGTIFKIYLPLVEAAVEPRSAAAGVSKPAHGSETILLVEDDESVRTFAQSVLGRAGYQVLSAADGNDAVTLAAREGKPIDLLLTDVVMPRMSGVELSDQLRASRPDVRVLYMSGYMDNAMVLTDISDLGTKLLPKPFVSDQLLTRVRAALDAPQPSAA